MAEHGTPELSSAHGALGVRWRVRFAAYSLLMTTAVLGGANMLIECAERRGLIDTFRLDDFLQHLDEELFTVEGEYVVTTDYAERSLLPMRIKAHKGTTWRMVLTGGSFALGPTQGHGSEAREEPGGIASWVRATLEHRHPGAPIEVVNLGGGGQDSNRVRQLAMASLSLHPDVLVVASCNNEGWESPGLVSRQLRQLGGYRLLSRLIDPTPADAERPLHTLQSPRTAQIRASFKANLAAIAAAARDAGVPLVLATLPVNLRYQGATFAHIDDGDGVPPYEPGPEVEAPCVLEGRARLASGDLAGARAVLEGCDDVAHALRVLGLVELALGQPDRARLVFESSLELLPYNRCRPSFEDVIREVAEEQGVSLLDLQARAEALSDHGIPGRSLFSDYCHMKSVGYLEMARALIEVLDTQRLAPPWPVDAASAAAWEQVVRERGDRALPGHLPEQAGGPRARGGVEPTP